MKNISNEIRKSLEAILDYSYSDEQENYEQENDVEISDDDYNNPENLEDKNHIFYHILVIQQFLNQ